MGRGQNVVLSLSEKIGQGKNMVCCALFSCSVVSDPLPPPWTEEPGRLQPMGILQARVLE